MFSTQLLLGIYGLHSNYTVIFSCFFTPYSIFPGKYIYIEMAKSQRLFAEICSIFNKCANHFVIYMYNCAKDAADLIY